MKKFLQKRKEILSAAIICLLFFIGYLALGLIKHLHFQTGYDLAQASQLVYEYSRLHLAISSIDNYSFIPGLWDHFELIYIILSPSYWIYPNAETLIVLQALVISFSGIPVFLLARKYKLNLVLCFGLLISYLLFYGIQNALYSDVHSLVFASAFLAFFIYFLDIGKKLPTVLFFFLAVVSKEDIALLTFLVSFTYFLLRRGKTEIYLIAASIFYLFTIFFVWYPHFTMGYLYANKHGLFSDVNLFNFFNTSAKRQVIFDSLLSFGFLPLLNPLLLIPFVGDLGHYFILGSDNAVSAQSIYMHYRSSNAILLVWPTILIIAKNKKLNNKYFVTYVLFFAFLTTYILHAPITYLSKKWFWTNQSAAASINKILKYLPDNAYVATQNNIAPHISNRKNIVLVFGEKKDFKTNSPCNNPTCTWLKWAGSPKYLVVDTSQDWNIINLLADRPDFVSGLKNMERAGNIKLFKKIENSSIYLIQKSPY